MGDHRAMLLCCSSEATPTHDCLVWPRWQHTQLCQGSLLQQRCPRAVAFGTQPLAHQQDWVQCQWLLCHLPTSEQALR